MTDSSSYEAFHYPPELFSLLVDTIPLLNRSKRDVLLFFRGAGVPPILFEDVSLRLGDNPQDVRKYEIARTILERLNAQGDSALRQRREIIRRVVQFESFDTCWPDDQLRAKGLVASVRDVVNQRDSFTRMNQEREHERRLRREAAQKELQEKEEKNAKIESAKDKLFRLFGSNDTPQSRGIDLEDALNSVFDAYDILIQDSFRLVGTSGEGTVEQIDGVIEFQGRVFITEMKWHSEPIGRALLSEHLVRIMSRAEAHGMFISASGYTSSAIAVCRDFLQHRLIVLIDLEEIVHLLDRQRDLAELLRSKIRAAQVRRNPYLVSSSSD